MTSSWEQILSGRYGQCGQTLSLRQETEHLGEQLCSFCHSCRPLAGQDGCSVPVAGPSVSSFSVGFAAFFFKIEGHLT